MTLRLDPLTAHPPPVTELPRDQDRPERQTGDVGEKCAGEHVRRDQRIKDELDRDEKFLAITDVHVMAADGQVLFQAPFLAIHRDHIVWVHPEQQKSEEGS